METPSQPESDQSHAPATGRSAQSAVRSPQSPFDRVRRYQLLWVLALVVFVLDQVTKIWINARLPLGTYGPPGNIVVIEGFFNLVHVGNTGAAWSMLAGKSTFLALLAFVTLGAIYLWRHELGLRLRVVQLSFGLLCGGIVGNLVDRMVHGHVIDFLDFHFGSYIYPTFNIADSGICVGVAIYLIHSLRQPPESASS
jgi:signal peptidase II